MSVEGMRREAMTEMGPNDMSGVVWAIVMSFFFFFLCFSIY